MHQINRRTWLSGAVSLLLTGCAAYAVRPATPAANLNVDPHEPPPPGEHYYLLVFGSQRLSKSPPYAHTFATVVHTVEQEPGCEKVVEHHTISWLPASLVIRPARLHPEPGVNLGLIDTLEYALKERERISLWGPYEIRPSFYQRFLVQKQFLESGAIGYQCVDNMGESARTGDGCACMHAITDTDPMYGRANYPLIWYGDAASEHLAYRLRDRGTLINPEVNYDHVLEPLGLTHYPITRRRLGDRVFDFPRVQPVDGILGRSGS